MTGTTTGSSVTLHTAHATALDLVWLFAHNSDTVDRLLTIEWGGTTSPDDLFKVNIPAGERVGVCSGDMLTGGLAIKAFGAAANVLHVSGYVERLTSQ